MNKTTGTNTHLPTRFYITEVICRYCDNGREFETQSEHDITRALQAHGWVTLVIDSKYVDICPVCALKEDV
jgi:hypothetical protein